MASVSKLVTQARTHMKPDEGVLAWVAGTYETTIAGAESVRKGIILATTERVVFYAKKLGGYDLESFPYGNISSFEAGKNIMGHWFRFAASGNDVTLKWIQGDVSQFAEAVRERAGHRPAAEPPSSVDPIAQLKQLAELRDAGVVSADEFEAKKQQLLGL